MRIGFKQAQGRIALIFNVEQKPRKRYLFVIFNYSNNKWFLLPAYSWGGDFRLFLRRIQDRSDGLFSLFKRVFFDRLMLVYLLKIAFKLLLRV